MDLALNNLKLLVETGVTIPLIDILEARFTIILHIFITKGQLISKGLCAIFT